MKTDRQERLFGGTAGVQADPCYHRACDDLDNIDDVSLKVMATAIADVVFRLASE